MKRTFFSLICRILFFVSILGTPALASLAAPFAPAIQGFVDSQTHLQVLGSGYMRFYTSDGVTPLAAYADATELVNFSGVTLNAYGAATVYLDGTYVIKVFDSVGSLQYTFSGFFGVDGLPQFLPNTRISGVNGTSSLPSYSFANATSSGMYWTGSNLAFAKGAAKVLELQTDGLHIQPNMSVTIADFLTTDRATWELPISATTLSTNSYAVILDSYETGTIWPTGWLTGKVYLRIHYTGGTSASPTMSLKIKKDVPNTVVFEQTGIAVGNPGSATYRYQVEMSQANVTPFYIAATPLAGVNSASANDRFNLQAGLSASGNSIVISKAELVWVW